MNQKRFINIAVIIGVVILAGVVGYFIVNQQTPSLGPVPSPTPASELTPIPDSTPTPTPTSTSAANAKNRVKIILTGPLQVIQYNSQGKEVVLDNIGNLLAGNRIGIVHDLFGKPSEVASIDVSFLHDQIRKVRENNEESFTSAILTIDLPANSAEGEYLLIYYLDSGNGKFDKGELFESSWTGSRGTFKLQFLKAVSEEKTKLGAQKGWNIVEGGFPQHYTQDFDNSILHIEPKPGIIID